MRALVAIDLPQGAPPPRIGETVTLSGTVVSRDQMVNEMLSQAERHVLRLIAAGRTTLEIAAERRCSPKTVHSTRRNIRKKLGIKNDVQAALIYQRQPEETQQ